MKILLQRVRWSIDEMRPLVGGDARPGKEKKILLRRNLLDPLVLLSNDIDIVSTEHEELDDLFQDIRRGRVRWMPDNPVEGRLH